MTRFLISFFFLFYLNQAAAQDYVWLGWRNSEHASPEGACRDWFGVTYWFSHYQLLADGKTAICHGGYALWEPRAEVRQIIAVHLYGDSCPSGKYYDAFAGVCSVLNVGYHKGASRAAVCETAGNPIIFTTGNKFQVEPDYVSGDFLEFYRFFNSADGAWRHGYSVRLRLLSETHIDLVLEDGRELSFRADRGGMNGFMVNSGSLAKIDNGWRYTSEHNETFNFDPAGRLTSWSNLQGESYSLNYANDVVTVVDHKGQQLQFTEDANHQPTTMIAAGVSAVYHYSPLGQLVKVAVTRNGQTTERQYHYEDSRNPKLLTGITDERGVRYATWAYDEQGRAIASEHAGGADKVAVAYNADGSSTVTNALGKQTTYRFQTIQGVRRITAIEGEPSANCPNSNSTFAYDERGLLTRKTDNKGNVTTYTYNDRGQEISRTEAAGTPQARTITTEWHPEFFLPSKVTEPGQVTVYTYNEQGREVGRTHSTN